MPFATEFVPVETRTGAAIGTNRRLLIVDQQPAFVSLARVVAQRLGYEIGIVSDTRELIARVQSWRPQVLVIEIVLPELDGIEIIGMLSELGFDSQLVLVTARDPRYIDLARKTAEAKGLRVAMCLSKPVRTAEMITALESCDAPAVTDGEPEKAA